MLLTVTDSTKGPSKSKQERFSITAEMSDTIDTIKAKVMDVPVAASILSSGLFLIEVVVDESIVPSNATLQSLGLKGGAHIQLVMQALAESPPAPREGRILTLNLPSTTTSDGNCSFHLMQWKEQTVGDLKSTLLAAPALQGLAGNTTANDILLSQGGEVLPDTTLLKDLPITTLDVVFTHQPVETSDSSAAEFTGDTDPLMADEFEITVLGDLPGAHTVFQMTVGKHELFRSIKSRIVGELQAKNGGKMAFQVRPSDLIVLAGFGLAIDDETPEKVGLRPGDRIRFTLGLFRNA